MLASVPHGHWKTIPFLAALRTNSLTAPLVVDGAIKGELFLGWVSGNLVPTLRWRWSRRGLLDRPDEQIADEADREQARQQEVPIGGSIAVQVTRRGKTMLEPPAALEAATP